MRNETKQIVQEYEVWIADDGTEFEDKEKCFRHELNCKSNAMRIQSLGASIPPPGITDFNDTCISPWKTPWISASISQARNAAAVSVEQ